MPENESNGHVASENGTVVKEEKAETSPVVKDEKTTTITPEQVLKEVRYAERLDDLDLRLATTLALGKEKSLAKQNQLRRQLYRELELIRIEIEEKLNEYGIESEWVQSASILEANTKMNSIRQKLRLEAMPCTGSDIEKAYMMVRCATFWLVFVGWFSAVVFLIPIRLIDQTLRQMGVPKNYLPMDIISWFMAALFCLCAGLDVTAEGREHLQNLNDSVVCMFSHASNLDGFIVNFMSPVAFKYAAKKSLFMIPFLGWVSRWGFGYVAIDRSNRKKALESLKELALSVNEQGNSVSISPEGTRSKDGLLQEFKKGPFYLQDDTKKNIVPALVFGAYEAWPPGQLFSIPGKTLVRFLPEFKPDPSKNRNLNRLALRRIYLEHFAADVPEDIGTMSSPNMIVLNLIGMYLIWCITIKVTLFSFSSISWICALLGISWWSYIKLSTTIIILLEAVMFTSC